MRTELDSRGNAVFRSEHLDAESRRLLEFAAMWAPYGGASEEDILVNFGLTTDGFVERLRRIGSNCGSERIGALAAAYLSSE